MILEITPASDTGIPNICKLRDNITFIAYWEQTGSRIVFLNITNPELPEFIAEFDTGSTYDFLFEDNLLITGNGDIGLQFVDITDLSNPTLQHRALPA